MTELSVVLFPTKTYNDYESDVESMLLQDDGRIVAKLDESSKAYYTVNMADTMKKLTRVGDLLEVAYATTKGYQCNTGVIGMLMEYQVIIGDSHTTCKTFLRASMAAMKYHALALKMVDKGKTDKALKFIGMTAKLAGEMAVVAEQLVNKCEDMRQRGETALYQATEDSGDLTKKQGEVKKSMDKAKAREAGLRKKQELFEQELQDLIEKEQQAAHTAHAERRSLKRLLKLAAAPLAAIGEFFLNRELIGESASAQERRLHAKRLEIQKEERNNLCELYEVVTRLGNTSVESSSLDKAVQSLDIAIRVLGQIKTVFENTHRFWEGMQKHCIGLSGTEEFEVLEEAEETEELRMAISDNGYSWMALSRMNFAAVRAIGSVSAKVDRIMCDLPTTEEAKDRIPTLTKMITSDLQGEIQESDRVLQLTS